MITFAVITCSDTRSEKEDTAGAPIKGGNALRMTW